MAEIAVEAPKKGKAKAKKAKAPKVKAKKAKAPKVKVAKSKILKTGAVMKALRAKGGKSGKLRISPKVKADVLDIAEKAVMNSMNCIVGKLPTYKKGKKKGMIKQKTLNKSIKLTGCP